MTFVPLLALLYVLVLIFLLMISFANVTRALILLVVYHLLFHLV